MSEFTRHLGLLLGARLDSLRNRVARVAPSQRLRLFGLVVGAGAVLLVLGHLAAPSLLEAPVEAATGGSFRKARALPAGTTALEAAFWLSALAASLTTFRAMELLFRRSDIRAVEPYPIALPALFIDRLMATLGEALVAALGVSLFFVPLCWHGAPGVTLLAAGLTGVGLLSSAAVGFAIQIYAGSLHVRSAESDGSSRGDVYGGGSQILMFSPGVALAIAAAVILLARLAFGELLADSGSIRAFWVAQAAIGLAVLGALIGAYRRFVARFPAMAARFREVDLVGFDVEMDYQTSAYERRTWGERLLPAPVRPSYRAASLQFGRRYALMRVSYALLWIGGALALAQWSREAFPPWAVAALPTVAVATLANVWARLTSDALSPRFAECLPVTEAQRTLASLGVAARESLLVATPYAALVVFIDADASTTQAAWEGVVAWLGPLGLNGAVAVGWRFAGRSPAVAVGAAVGAAVVLAAAAIVALPLAAGAAAVGLAAAVPGVIDAARASRQPRTSASAT